MNTLDKKHKSVAHVGHDIIPDVEYIEMDFAPLSTSQITESIWVKTWDNITWAYHRIKGWIRDTYWEVRYGIQRMFQGYDVVDTFETFSKFTERYEKILKDYRAHHHGYPTNMTNEEWEEIVDDMIYHLYYMDEENVEKELCSGMPKTWVPDPATTYEIMERHKDEFFKLFSKYFYDLWD